MGVREDIWPCAVLEGARQVEELKRSHTRSVGLLLHLPYQTGSQGGRKAADGAASHPVVSATSTLINW